ADAEADQHLFPPALTEAELADLPLRAAPPAPSMVEGPAVTVPRRPGRPSLDDEVLVDRSDLDSGIEIEPLAAEPSPLERPARALERAQAAAFDLALFAAIAAVVVYFAGRAARVDLPSLAASWPWFLGFIGVLAGFYACYFTGTTGQTPGKLITGLRVVDAGGRPPGYPRALGRALVGLLGVTLAGAGLAPIAFDPAGRALHDRLFRTRVVRR
ncbi:MAG: RDD family protein, partial [Betaproteobacteria bacterium]